MGDGAMSPGLWVDPARLLLSLARMIEDADTPPREKAAAASVARSVGMLGSWNAPHLAELTTAQEQAGFAGDERALPGGAPAGEAPRPVSLPRPDPAMLESCLRHTLPGGEGGRVENLDTIEGGYSKQTTLFDWVCADGRRVPYVMRRDVDLQHVGTSVTDEYDVVVALFDAGLAVPRPVALVRECEGIAQDFMITERMAGRSIGGPLGSGETGIDPVPALAGFLARLHTLDPAALGIARFARPFDMAALEGQLRYWTERYRAHRTVPSPLLDAALTWLWDHRAAGVQPGAVVHGDGGIYNMLFDGDRFTAMLDWELVHVGSPVWDLAYVRGGVGAFGSFERFVDLYVEAGGRRPAPAALGFYDVFCTVRSAIMCAVGAALFNRGEPVSFDLLHVNLMLYPRLVGALPAAIAAADALPSATEDVR